LPELRIFSRVIKCGIVVLEVNYAGVFPALSILASTSAYHRSALFYCLCRTWFHIAGLLISPSSLFPFADLCALGPPSSFLSPVWLCFSPILFLSPVV